MGAVGERAYHAAHSLPCDSSRLVPSSGSGRSVARGSRRVRERAGGTHDVDACAGLVAARRGLVLSGWTNVGEDDGCWRGCGTGLAFTDVRTNGRFAFW